MGNAVLGQVLLATGVVTANVVIAVLLSEVFPTAVRYTASAITYNFSYAILAERHPSSPPSYSPKHRNDPCIRPG